MRARLRTFAGGTDTGPPERRCVWSGGNDPFDRVTIAVFLTTSTVIRGQEAERMRIAGELHDGVLQQMTSVGLGTVKYQFPPDSEARTMVSGMEQRLVQPEPTFVTYHMNFILHY
jgi:hypothetical protein